MVDVLQVVAYELLDRRILVESLLAHVDEQGPRERVLARLDGLHAGRYTLNLERLEPLLVLLEVAEAEVSQGVRVAGHTLNQHVVVLAGLVVRPALLLLADSSFGEELEGTRLGAGAVEVDLLLGPLGAHLVPGGDLAVRVELPERLELVERYVVREVVLGVDHDRDAVLAYREFDKLDAVLLTVLLLLIVDRTGSVRDGNIPTAEGLHAVTGAGPAHAYLHVRILLAERLGRPLGNRQHGAGALDSDLARTTGPTAFLRFGLAAGGLPAAFLFFFPPTTAAAGQDQGQGHEQHPG